MSPPATRRLRCPRCGQPASACLCAWVCAVDNPTPVCVLQHPQEAGHAKGTVTLLQLSLARCEVHVGEVFDPAALGLGHWQHWALLYPPGPGPAGLPAADTQAPRGLLVLDGTWRKTHRMLCRNPWLAGLPRLGLNTAQPSAYRIRQARHAHQLSTLEATAWALGQIEGAPGRYTGLLQGLDGFVAAVARRLPQRAARTAPEPATAVLTCGGLPE